MYVQDTNIMSLLQQMQYISITSISAAVVLPSFIVHLRFVLTVMMGQMGVILPAYIRNYAVG